MPVLGIGLLHIAVAIFFAIHVVRSGQQMYWLMILLMFPLLGSIVYFVAIWLPGSNLRQGARKVASVAAKSLDPSRELREARAAFDYTPTAQNQMRLATAQLEAGAPGDAAATYEACLQGAFAADPEIRYGAARASVACQRYPAAINHLLSIRQANPAFRAEQVSLLMAQALAGAGRQADAKAEFEHALGRFGGFTVRAEYVIWAAASGDGALARQLYVELEQSMARWTRQTRALNQPLIRRLAAAMNTLR